MSKPHFFRRTAFSGSRGASYKGAPADSIYETPPDGKMKASMVKRGIIEGRFVTVEHPQKAWSRLTKSTGVIVQVTHYFFVLRQPKEQYSECFLFVDVMRNLVNVKEARPNT